jgi:hypothetical protein
LHYFKGVVEPRAVFCVLGPQEVPGAEEDAGLARVPFLVGRDEEMGLLLRRWEQSKEGLGQVVLLRGEAGIGKSALGQTLREHVGLLWMVHSRPHRGIIVREFFYVSLH